MRIRALLALSLVLAACSTHPKNSSPCAPVAMATYPEHKGGGFKHDPHEDDPRLRQAFQEADAYAERMTANDPPRLGEIHECWRYKKEFLLWNYRIRWKSPAEMNPTIAFD